MKKIFCYKELRILLAVLLAALIPNIGAAAERKYVEIKLSSGETVEGHLIEKTDTSIKIERFGKELTYSLNDIAQMMISAQDCKEQKEATQMLKEVRFKWDDKSIQGYREIIQKYPFSCAAQAAEKEIVEMYTRAGRYEESTAAMDEYIQKHPATDEAAGFILSKADRLRGDGVNAEQMKHDDKARRLLQESLKEYRRLIKDYPDSSRTQVARWYTLEIEFEHLKTVSGEAAVARFKEFYPDSADDYYRNSALWNIAKIYKDQLNNYDKALEYFQIFIDKFPNGDWEAMGQVYLQANLERAECYLRKGDYGRVFEEWEKCILNSKNVGHRIDALTHFVFTGEELFNKKDWDMALEAFRRYSRLAPGLMPKEPELSGPSYTGNASEGGHRYICKRMADVYLQIKDYKQAADALQKSLSGVFVYVDGFFRLQDKSISFTFDASEISLSLASVYQTLNDVSQSDQMKRKSESLSNDMEGIREVIMREDASEGTKVTIKTMKITNSSAEVEYDCNLINGGWGGQGFKVFLQRTGSGWSIGKKERTWVS